MRKMWFSCIGCGQAVNMMVWILMWLWLCDSLVVGQHRESHTNAADVSIAPSITKLAFGSCHKRKYVQAESSSIWKAIVDTKPDAFLWTGDAVYPPSRGVAPIAQLRAEYHQMLTNDTIGYKELHPPYGIYGSWDDHDYGANDYGLEMPDKAERRDLYLDFLGVPASAERRQREGVYHSVEWGQPPNKVKAILLDTRWHRETHCIPSIAASLPLGAALSCVTRWLAAGLNLPSWKIRGCRNDASLLGKEQWEWLEHEVRESDAQVHVVVSSIQLLTTNPVMESWGHFVEERRRLLELLNGVPGLVVLSGDVHHAEILDVTAAVQSGKKKQSFLEITSSGLTHSCTKPFYGGFCEPLLNTFDAHRFKNSPQLGAQSYFLERNFGTLEVDWEKRVLEVFVHDRNGTIVLSTGLKPFHLEKLTAEELLQVAPVIDGHLVPLAKNFFIIMSIAVGLGLLFYFLMQRLQKRKKTKSS